MFEDSIDNVTATIDAYDSRGEIEFTLFENGTVGGEAVGTFAVPEAAEDFWALMEDNEPIPQREFHGELSDGGEVTLLDTRLGMKCEGLRRDGTQITELHPRRLQIDTHDNEPILDSCVTVEIDVLNAECLPRPRSEPPGVPILERESWHVNIKPVEHHWDRIDLIQERKQTLRTSKLVVEQHEDCPPRIQLQRAIDRTEPLLWLFSVIQGVLPAPIAQE